MIVENFGGSIALKSVVGQGSTFTFVVALEELCDEDDIGESRCKNPLNMRYPKQQHTYNVDRIYDDAAFTQWTEVREDEAPINLIVHEDLPDQIESRDNALEGSNIIEEPDIEAKTRVNFAVDVTPSQF